MDTVKIHDKEFVPYLKHDEIQEIIKNLAEKVYEDYKDEAFRPTYWSGWSPKLLTIQNEKGETRQIQANTNAKVGQYVNVDQETV